MPNWLTHVIKESTAISLFLLKWEFGVISWYLMGRSYLFSLVLAEIGNNSGALLYFGIIHIFLRFFRIAGRFIRKVIRIVRKALNLFGIRKGEKSSFTERASNYLGEKIANGLKGRHKILVYLIIFLIATFPVIPFMQLAIISYVKINKKVDTTTGYLAILAGTVLKTFLMVTALYLWPHPVISFVNSIYCWMWLLIFRLLN